MTAPDDERAGPPDGAVPDQSRRAFDARGRADEVTQPIRDLKIDPASLLGQAIEQTRMALCLVDPHAPDQPIMLVNRAFVEMTGYARDEIVGRNCRFLQGPDTAPGAVRRIRAALEAEEVCVIEIRNYRKDGTPFWNALHVGPIYDADGKLALFYGSQWDVTELVAERDRADLNRVVAEELQHRTRNLFAVLSSIVRVSAAAAPGPGASALAATIVERINALSRAHQASIAADPSLGIATDLHGLIEAILRPYRTGGSARIEIAGPGIQVERGMVTPLGVVLHELATNAVKHGALSGRDGRLSVAWEEAGDGIRLLWTEKGVPVTGDGGSRATITGSGGRIVETILSTIGGSLETEMTPDGLKAALVVPVSG